MHILKAPEETLLTCFEGAGRGAAEAVPSVLY